LRTLISAITLIFTLIVLSGPAHSASPDMSADISSERMEQHEGMYYFEGSVQINRQHFSLWSERAVVSEADSTLEAEGSVIINSPDFYATGSRTSMDLDKGTGVLHDAQVHFLDGDYYVDAEEFEMLGDGHYRLKRATLTTCTDLPPAWCIRGSEVDILVGERIVATHARFKVKNVPVLYTPYLWAPIVTDRRTGPLPPNFGYRKSTGLHISQPFFWAISESRDATLTLDYHTKEAFGQEVEYRYIEAPHITGQWNIMHLRDTEHALDYYETRIRHRHDGEPVSGFLNIHTINREDYYRLYEDYLEDSSRRYLESTAEVAYSISPEKPFGNSRLYASARNYQDLMEGVRSEEVLQRRPEVGISVAPLGPGSLDFFGRARSITFDREVGTEGRRADLEAMASLTMGSAVLLRQEVGAERHVYEVNEAALPTINEETTLYSYRADLGFTASRAYRSLTHEVSPSLIYSSTVLEGDTPARFDIEDTAADSSTGTLQLVNRLLGERGRLVSLQIKQTYDFLAEDEPYRPISTNLSLMQPSGPATLSLGFTYDHYDRQIRSMNSRLKLQFKRVYFEAGQQYNRQSEVETYSADAGLKVNDKLKLLAGMRYDKEEEDGLEEVSAGLNYQSQCWGIRLTYVKKPDDYAVYMQLTLLGLGEARFN